MDRHRTSSQLSIDRKGNTLKDSTIISVNKQNQIQNEIDNLIQHGILDPMVEYDGKLSFTSIAIINRDQAIRQTRRQTSGLIWNSIRSPSISKLVHDDRSCAFVEILRTPPEWSRYDADLFLLKIRQRQFLNGLALRDEFVRVLQIILKRDFNEENTNEKKYPYILKDVDYTRNVIQLVFSHRYEFDLTLILSLLLLVEFNVPCSEFFPDIYSNLCCHQDLNEYFKYYPDAKRTRLTPYNPIKFLYDYSSTETNLCDYLLQRTDSLTTILITFLKLRKEWSKHIQRAAKYATDTLKLQPHAEKHHQSTASINSARSGRSNASTMNKLAQHKLPFTTQIEIACECLFSIPLLRLLFLTVCSQYQQFGNERDNDTAFTIDKALQILSNALENTYLEHPFFPNRNILPETLLTHDIGVKVAIQKLLKEMQREWKRNIRR